MIKTIKNIEIDTQKHSEIEMVISLLMEENINYIDLKGKDLKNWKKITFKIYAEKVFETTTKDLKALREHYSMYIDELKETKVNIDEQSNILKETPEQVNKEFARHQEEKRLKLIEEGSK